jgi:hypothetical protein
MALEKHEMKTGCDGLKFFRLQPDLGKWAGHFIINARSARITPAFPAVRTAV